MYSYFPIHYCPCYFSSCPYFYLTKDKFRAADESDQQFRKSKKIKDKIYIPEVIDLVTCFNPAILYNKEFNCIARLNARKIVKKMLNSILECDTPKYKEQQQFWQYYYFFNNCR